MASVSGEGEGGSLHQLSFGMLRDSLGKNVVCSGSGAAHGLGVIFAPARCRIEANIELDAPARLAAFSDVAFHLSFSKTKFREASVRASPRKSVARMRRLYRLFTFGFVPNSLT